MKLKTQLISSFSLTILLVVIVATVCIYTTQIVNSAFREVTEQAIPKLIILDDIKTTFLKVGLEAISQVLIQTEMVHELGAFKNNTSIEGEVEEFEQANKELEKLLITYQHWALQTEEIVVFEKLHALNQQFQAACVEILQAEEHVSILENKEKLEDVEDEFVEVIDNAIATANAHTNMSSQFAHDKSKNALHINLLIMIIAVTLAFIFAFTTVRAIINPISTLQIAAEKLTHGDWKKIEINQHHDELRQLTTSFNEMATELCHSLNELESKNNALVQLHQEKNDFIGIVVHDLKNPLSAILGMAEMTEESIGNTSEEELILYTQIIQNSSKAMFMLISNLLDISAIESNKINLLIEPTDMLPIVQTLIKEYSKRAQDKEIELSFKTELKQCIAEVDKNTTHQILDNLISNAIKYSPIGKRIYIQLIEEEDKVRCEIQDEGVGLSQEDQQKLFGKFTRLTPKPTGNENSNGLGLFIVKKFVDAMNGQVWCESELGKGAKFVIAFFKNKPIH